MTRPVRAVSLLLLVAVACDFDLVEIEALAEDDEDPVTVTVSTAVLVADGNNTALITAALGPQVPEGMAVTFATNGGGFREAGSDTSRSVTVRAVGREAAATFIAPNDTSAVVIRVTAAGHTREATITLQPALPSEILLTADKSASDTTGGAAVTFSAQLVRETGTVSKGLRVRFLAEDPGGTALSEFDGIAFVTAGTAKHSITSARPITVVMRAEVAGAPTASNQVTVIFR